MLTGNSGAHGKHSWQMSRGTHSFGTYAGGAYKTLTFLKKYSVGTLAGSKGSTQRGDPGNPRVCVCFALVPSVDLALNSGATFTSRTTSAPWAVRAGHTSVIDAAGAIYVIGGYGGSNGGTYLQDVWASTDGGADLEDALLGNGVVLTGR